MSPKTNANVRMMLVDDDESVIRLLSTLIGRSFEGKISLTALIDSKAARWHIMEAPPDLVLTDLEMPIVSGVEILRCAKRLNPCSQVIVYSAFFSPDRLSEVLGLGASDYLLKCGDMEEVISALRYAYERIIRWRQAVRGVGSGESGGSIRK